jgi:hypothetical protein
VEEEFTVLDHDQATRIGEFFGANGDFKPNTWQGQPPSALVESLIRSGGAVCSAA